MRNAVCWLIVALLTLQVSLLGIDVSDGKISDFKEDKNDEDVKFSGRQSNGMNGNVTADSDCDLTNWHGPSDGLGGPVWQNGSTYATHSIVEWPANSGHFYQAMMNTSASPGDGQDHWEGPCTCAEIGEYSGITWDATASYDPWQIVEHNGEFWIAQDAGTMQGDEPAPNHDLWEQCTHEDSTPCDELIGMTNIMVWDTSMLVTEGEIYEFPANSSNFYMVAPLISSQTVGEPGVDLDAWDEEYCDCKDIWHDSGQPVWDSSIHYLQHAVVEWPAGSSILYISFDHGLGVEPGSANSSHLWRICGDQQPSGGPCEEFNGYGGMPWTNTTLVFAGEIYEFPAGSGQFYTVSSGISNQTVGAPGLDFDAWSEKYCTCEDIWMTAGSPVWDSNTVYSAGMMVEYPANSGDIWMAVVSQTTTGVTPDQPFADGNQWELCGGEEPSDGPCGGLMSVGVWDNLSRVSTGEIYEYPANSGNYYEVIIQGYVDQSVDSPTTNMDIWAPVDCPCEEEWMAAGSPVWDASTTYPTNSVVEWPAGSSMLYIAWASPGPGDEPDTDPEWELCSSPDDNSTDPSEITPCAGLTIVGVWDNTTAPAVGDIYEFPANSGTYYQIIFVHEDANGGPDWIADPTQQDGDEFWVPYSCPCKTTWVANGQPVWDDTLSFYPGNFVVEWPAGSGALYISEGGGLTGSVEPGIDGHWIPCEGNPEPEAEAEEEEEEEEDSIPSIGVALTLLGILSASAFIGRSRIE